TSTSTSVSRSVEQLAPHRHWAVASNMLIDHSERIRSIFSSHLISDQTSQWLADGALRQWRVTELNEFRNLVCSELLHAVGDERLGSKVGIFFHNDDLHGFAGPIVRCAYRRNLKHTRMHRHDLLDLVGKNLEPRHDDHILLAVGDLDVSPFVHESHVARAQPALRIENLNRLVRAVPIALHDLRSTNPKLAYAAQRQFIAIIVAERDLRRRNRQARHTRVFARVEPVASNQRRGLRET